MRCASREETFEMPLDINAAPAVSALQPRRWTRRGGLRAVERYLAARGFSTAALRTAAASNVAAEVVDRFLAKKETAKGAAEPAATVD